MLEIIKNVKLWNLIEHFNITVQIVVGHLGLNKCAMKLTLFPKGIVFTLYLIPKFIVKVRIGDCFLNLASNAFIGLLIM